MTDTKHEHQGEHPAHRHDVRAYVDPVCGMSTEDPDAFTRYDHEGKDYYFCSGHCLEKFKRKPAEFFKEKSGPPRRGQRGATRHRQAIYLPHAP